MHKSLLPWIVLFSQPLVAQINTNAPTVLPPDSPQLHLLNKTPPIYPPIARAAHVAGAVSVQIVIAPDGHIISARVLSGPEMLRGAATDMLRRWLYSPVLVDGKPVSALTTVIIPFDLNDPSSQYAKPSPADAQDRKLDKRLHPLEEACTQSLSSSGSPPSKQIELCQKAADLADQFSDNGFEVRRRTFTYLSTAFLRNKQIPDALSAANKAVAAVQQGFEDGQHASSSYSVRAQAEAQLGKLAEASEDLTIAEEAERRTIAHAFSPTPNKDFDKMNQSFAKSNYIPVLKGLLIYHAKILTALGKTTEASAKIAEADKE